MYTLRKIDPTDVESNFELGESYTLILRTQERSRVDFNKALSSYLGKEISAKMSESEIKDGENIYGFVFSEHGKMNPLQSKCKYYIMTESGKTFSNLSIK